MSIAFGNRPIFPLTAATRSGIQMQAILHELQCIVFDVDGVLLDSWPLMQFALTRAHAACGATGEVPVEGYRRQLGRPLPEIAETLGLPPEFVTHYRNVSRDNLDRASLYVGARETVATLAARGVKLALNTSKDRLRTLQMLRRFELESCFSAVVTADDVEHGKPHPESLLRAMELTDSTREQTAFIGDSPIDIACARNVGVLSIAATWGMGTAQELEQAGPDTMISDIRQLVDPG